MGRTGTLRTFCFYRPVFCPTGVLCCSYCSCLMLLSLWSLLKLSMPSPHALSFEPATQSEWVLATGWLGGRVGGWVNE